MTLIEEIVELGYEHDRLMDSGRLSDAAECLRELEALRDVYRRQEEEMRERLRRNR